LQSSTLIAAALLCLTPISELRGGLPFALARGMPLPEAYLLCVGVNALVGPLVYLFFSSVHRLLVGWPAYRRFFDRVIERARRRVHDRIARFGILGLILFVGIPLPFTGAYTGAVGAWVLGMNPGRVFVSVLVGVLVSGAIVATVYTLGIHALGVFIK
jgi:uncharacterized membrane protein